MRGIQVMIVIHHILRYILLIKLELTFGDAATPSFTLVSQLYGNNQAIVEDQPDGSYIEGHKVTFTNTTSGVGNFGQQFTWKFDDKLPIYGFKHQEPSENL